MEVYEMTGNFESEVGKAEQAFLEAAKRGDADAFVNHFHQEMDIFWFDGRPLLQAPESQTALRAPFDRGSKFDLKFDDLRISIFGNQVAISTGNLKGTFLNPDGSEFDMGFRITSIRVKEGDEWKIVHVHESPIQSES
jgi:ketosteroid isomerase-like protein